MCCGGLTVSGLRRGEERKGEGRESERRTGEEGEKHGVREKGMFVV